jgi:ApaG protein
MSEACTRGVRVRVRSQFVAERSNPARGEYFFAYRIEITNVGEVSVQLLRRRWQIIDAHGEVQEVEGPGVVGEQPVLSPGQAFEYTSACPLSTPFGSMRGHYQMITDAGEEFDAEIAPFSLEQPYSVH